MGRDARDMMHSGLIWYPAATTARLAPWAAASLVMAGSLMATSALPETRMGMPDTVGPPERMSTSTP